MTPKKPDPAIERGEDERRLLAYIAATPVLRDWLYDLSMLPEQLTHGSPSWERMLRLAAEFEQRQEAVTDRSGAARAV